MAILISDKTDFTIKSVFTIKSITRDKEGHYITIKGSIQEDDIKIVNIYALNIGAPKYIKQIRTSTRKKNRQEHSNSRRLQHPTYINGQIIQIENQ